MLKSKYKLTNKIVSNLTKIVEAKVIIEQAKILPAQELNLRRQALIRMTQSSTAIEGNILNIKQVEDILGGRKVDAPLRDIYEVKNYLRAIKYIEKFVKEKKQISKHLILAIHRLVTDKTLPKTQCGYYRKSKIYIVRRKLGMPDEIIYTGPPANNVPDLIEDLISWIKKSQKQNIHPIIVAGIVHRELAAIHPFSDGNGRTARALATFILYQRNFDLRGLFALEDYYNKDRPVYYKAINIGKKYSQMDFTKWLEYFIKGFRAEIELVKEKVLSLAVIKASKQMQKQIQLTKRQIKIIDFINTIGKITAGDAVDVLGCPKRTAQLELQKLKKLKIIKQIGKGPATAYILS